MSKPELKFRVHVRINDVTGDRMYHPQQLRYSEVDEYRMYARGETPVRRWRDLPGLTVRYETDADGQYVKGVWTLEWAEAAIESERKRQSWYDSHELNDDGTVDVCD